MKKYVLTALAMATLAGCATPIAMQQKQEFDGYKAKGLALEEKNVGLATALGLLPGGGSFYTGHPLPGVVNLIFYPLSILWDPVSGYEGATSRNYYATKLSVERNRKKEMTVLDGKVAEKTMTLEEYVKGRREIEDKYTPL